MIANRFIYPYTHPTNNIDTADEPEIRAEGVYRGCIMLFQKLKPLMQLFEVAEKLPRLITSNNNAKNVAEEKK